MRWLRRLAALAAGVTTLAALGAIIAATLVSFDHAPLPAEGEVLNADRLTTDAAYDVLGRRIGREEAAALLLTPAGRTALSPAAGAIRIDEALERSGRDLFYRETFGNQAMLSDIAGILDGALSPLGLFLAVSELGGRGTSDLKVRLAADIRIGERMYRRGELISTGLDVPRGEAVPLGIRAFYEGGRLRVGFTCALCHATVDRATGRVVEGAPNTDLRAGLLLALAANPAAFWPLTGTASIEPFRTRPDHFVRRSGAGTDLLPDPGPLAARLRADLAAWAPGSADTTGDRVSNPTSIPALFVREAWPYGWSGQASIGPFRGLVALSDVVHGLGGDAAALSPAARTVFGLDPEVYLGTLLQAAPDAGFRFDAAGNGRPSDILRGAAPTPGAPGVTRLATIPGFPRANYMTAYGAVPVTPGMRAGEPAAALAAFLDRLRPPGEPLAPDARAMLERGHRVFDRAGCLACHSGPARTSHRVWPVEVIGTEPSRARAFAGREAAIAKPMVFAPDTPVPVPADAALLPVPVPDEGQLKLAWAHNQTKGGYKVPALIGLAWTAPYLHDGGVAVGPDPERREGVPASIMAGLAADPRNSLRALVDRTIRERVVRANEASAEANLARVSGRGHLFWVDREAGYSDEEREALLTYLLSIDRPRPDADPVPRP